MSEKIAHSSLIKLIQDKIGVNADEIKKIIDIYRNTVLDLLKDDNIVSTLFGTLKVGTVKERLGRNMKGEYKVPSHKRVRLYRSKALKELLK